MPSAIDPTKPVDGIPASKAELRANLLAAKTEIEALQASTGAMAVASTIADLTALVPVAGQSVYVLGYLSPGDGGGGLFYADTTGALETDGALVFPYDGDLSTQQTESFTPGGVNNAVLDTNLAFGTVEIEFATSPTTVSGTSWHLHGHRLVTNGVQRKPYVDHKTGVISDLDNRINAYTSAYASGANVTFRYKTIGNARRWVRTTDGTGVLPLAWFGIDPTWVDNTALERLCWACNVAARLGFTVVDCGGKTYRYRNTLEIPDGVTIRNGIWRCIDTDVLVPLRLDYDGLEIERALNDNPYPAWAPENNAMSWGLENIELDGNWQNNPDPWANYVADYDDLPSVLQNSAAYNGVAAFNHGGRVIPEGSKASIINCSIHGYGGNCLIGQGGCLFTTVNLHLYDSVKNHPLYSAQGTHTGMRLSGFAWGSHVKVESAEFIGLTINDLVINPVVAFQSSQNIMLYEGMDYDATQQTSHRYLRRGFHVSDFSVNLDNGGAEPVIGRLFCGIGDNLVVENGVIIGSATYDTAVFSELGNGFQHRLERAWALRNVSLVTRGTKDLTISGSFPHYAHGLVIENVVKSHDPAESAAAPAARMINLQDAIDPTTRSNDPGWSYPRQITVRGVCTDPDQSGSDALGLLAWDCKHADAADVHLRIEDCHWTCRGTSVLHTVGSTGNTGALTVNAPEKLILELVGGRCWNQSGFNGTNMRLLLRSAGYIENFRILMDDMAGDPVLVSDEIIEAEIASATGGETSLDVQTELFWPPQLVIVHQVGTKVVTDLSYEIRLSDNSTTTTYDAINDTTPSALNRRPIIRLKWPAGLAAADNVKFVLQCKVKPPGARLV